MSAGDAAPAAAVRVLVAEDEEHLGTLLEQFLVGRGHAVTLVRDGHAALAALRGHDFDVALTDVQMPGPDGLALLAAARALPLPPEVIVASGNGAADTVLRALRAGAYDAVAKPYRMAEVELLVRRAAEKREMRRLVAAAAVRDATLPPCDDPVLMAHAGRLTARDAGHPLLLLGEPGTGRRTLARAIHAHAGRTGSFVPADAATIARGAQRGRLIDGAPGAPSMLTLARGGTLCVSRAEALEPSVTEALLDVAFDGACALVLTAGPASVPGGPARSRIAALRERVVRLAPLRERAADVVPLAGVVARRMLGGPVALAPDAAALLLARRWPGNLAELAAVVGAAVAAAAVTAALGAGEAMPELTAADVEGHDR